MVFAVGDDKEKWVEKEKREGKGRECITKSQDVIFQLFIGRTAVADSTKFGARVAPHHIIKMSNFCNKIFRGFRSTGGQIAVFPLTLPSHHYDSAQPVVASQV